LLYLVDQDVPHVAERFLDAVEKTISKLTTRPSIGAPKKFRDPRLYGLRTWPVTGFEAVRIYYLLSADVLTVVRILHGKRDLDRLL
jgi:plasmid stabilization system protein ParE